MIDGVHALYYEWLISQVGVRKSDRAVRTYAHLLNQLDSIEFRWFVPNDGNRVDDAIELRIEFVHQQALVGSFEHWFRPPCSMLEVLIGLSRRLSFETGRQPRDCFWLMLYNCGLDRHHDRHPYSSSEVEEIVRRILLREYEYNGQGGLFPLNNPARDQTHVELWYQMNSYLLENG